MSLFDTISNTVSSLFDDAVDWIGDQDGSDILGGAVKGYKALTDKQDADAADDRILLSFLERNSRMMDTDNDWAKMHQPSKAGFGTPDYSANYKQIQAEWMAFLRGVDGTKTVPGKRYSELN